MLKDNQYRLQIVAHGSRVWVSQSQVSTEVGEKLKDLSCWKGHDKAEDGEVSFEFNNFRKVQEATQFMAGKGFKPV